MVCFSVLFSGSVLNNFETMKYTWIHAYICLFVLGSVLIEAKYLKNDL